MMVNVFLAALGGLAFAFALLISSGVPLAQALVDCALGALILAGFLYTFRKRFRG